MPDDDPIEDLQRAGATAGAAGARAVEAALRSRQQQVQQTQGQAVDDQQEQPRTVAEWEREARSRTMGGYGEQLTQPETSAFLGQLGKEAGVKQANSAAAVDEMGNGISYDSPEARAGRHDAMEAAGVPLEARQAAMTADKMNATDPAMAARSGSVQRTQPSRKRRTPQRERGR